MLPYTAGMADFDTALEECEYQGMWFAEGRPLTCCASGAAPSSSATGTLLRLPSTTSTSATSTPSAPGTTRTGRMCTSTTSAAPTGWATASSAASGRTPTTGPSWASSPTTAAPPDVRVANIRQFLHERGFLVLKGGHDNLVRDQVREEEIDFERTRAYMKDDKGFDIFINAEPGPGFDRIEAELLLALRTWVDEEVGRNPVAVALPRRDAWLLGQWGDQCGGCGSSPGTTGT